jgi:hypothetical protein
MRPGHLRSMGSVSAPTEVQIPARNPTEDNEELPELAASRYSGGRQ